jgi:hypothetical protein
MRYRRWRVQRESAAVERLASPSHSIALHVRSLEMKHHCRRRNRFTNQRDVSLVILFLLSSLLSSSSSYHLSQPYFSCVTSNQSVKPSVTAPSTYGVPQLVQSALAISITLTPPGHPTCSKATIVSSLSLLLPRHPPDKHSVCDPLCNPPWHAAASCMRKAADKTPVIHSGGANGRDEL